MSELTALYQDRKSTCYWSSGQKIVISSKSAHTRSILTLAAWTSGAGGGGGGNGGGRGTGGGGSIRKQGHLQPSASQGPRDIDSMLF